MIGVIWWVSVALGLFNALMLDEGGIAMRLVIYWPLMTITIVLALACMYMVCFEWWLKDFSPWFEIKGEKI